jgi:hypothetical protein
MLRRAALALASAGARSRATPSSSSSSVVAAATSRGPAASPRRGMVGVTTKAAPPGPSPPGAAAAVAATAAEGGSSPAPLTIVTPERRLSAIAGLWATTRDAPELGVLALGVGTALSLLAYTTIEMISGARGEHLGILANPDVRGDLQAQMNAAQRAADATARAEPGAAAAGSSGPAGGKRSLWYVLGHVLVDDQGANVSVWPFSNRVRPFQYSKPAVGRVSGGVGSGGTSGAGH